MDAGLVHAGRRTGLLSPSRARGKTLDAAGRAGDQTLGRSPRFDLGEHGERVEQTIEHLHQLAGLGIQVTHGTLIGAGSLRPLELMAERIIPAVGTF